MFKSKNSWLSGAALLTFWANAQAADLPFNKSAPVEYLRICDAFGAGFFYIPGTDSCLRFSGQMRAEYSLRGGAPSGNPAANSVNLAGGVYRRALTSLRARAYINADSRTETAYGTLRTYLSMRITVDDTAPGPFGGGKEPAAVAAANGRALTPASTGAFQGVGPTGSQVTLDRGFIQFAGITAGRAQSFFDFDAQSYELLTNTVANSNQITEVLAYTAIFGNGYSATVSLEDGSERSIGDSGLYQAGGVINGVAFTSTQQPTATHAGYLAYGGATVPDVVGNLRYDGAWGSAQLSGAYHNLSSRPVTLAAKTVAGPAGKVIQPGDVAGFAALAGLKLLTPFTGKGDNFTVQGTYQSGAMGYMNSINYLPVGLNNVYDNNTSVSVPINDAFVNPAGQIVKSTAAGIFAAYRHYWIPEVSSSVYGDYAQIHNPISAQLIGAGADNARVYQVGFNTIWSPIKDFQVGAEVLYSNLLLTGQTKLLDHPASGTSPKDSDDLRARVSLRRAF
jgi:hypothetical protein